MDIISYILAKKYTDNTVDGMGALKGAPCTVKSIENITGGKRITLEWESNSGVKQTQSFDVIDGKDGANVVEWSQIQQSGTKIAEININGVSTDIYSPDGGGSSNVITGTTDPTDNVGSDGDIYVKVPITDSGYSYRLYTISGGGSNASIAVQTILDEVVINEDVILYQTPDRTYPNFNVTYSFGSWRITATTDYIKEHNKGSEWSWQYFAGHDETIHISGCPALAHYIKDNGVWLTLDEKPEGHTIVNKSNTNMNQRTNLQFTGNVSVSDDSTNDKTIVNIQGINIDDTTVSTETTYSSSKIEELIAAIPSGGRGITNVTSNRAFIDTVNTNVTVQKED